MRKVTLILIAVVVLITACGGETYTVKYVVSGSATEFNIGYRADGEQRFVDGFSGDWERTFYDIKFPELVTLEVQPVSDDGTAICTILVNGEQVDTDVVGDWLETAKCQYRLP